MNWGGFPIGFRFPVMDYSIETKSRCWQTVIHAASYADIQGMFFHESCIIDDATQQKVYIAIVAFPDVYAPRKNGILWGKDSALLASLCWYRPFVQENYLEMYAPSVYIGKVLSDRTIEKADGCSYIPDAIGNRLPPVYHKRALLIWKTSFVENTDTSFHDTLTAINEKYPDYAVDRFFISNGTLALISAGFNRGNRLIHIPLQNKEGNIIKCSFVLLPHNSILFDYRPYIKDNPCIIDLFLETVSDWKFNTVYLIKTDNSAEYQMSASVKTLSTEECSSLLLSQYISPDLIIYNDSVPEVRAFNTIEKKRMNF